MSMGAVTIDSIVVASGEQISSSVADDLVILNLKNGSYYALDEIGLLIWSRLATPQPVRALREAVLAEYDVDAEQCAQDVIDLLTELATERLIEVRHAVDAPAARA